ncbi:MAG: RNA polymerase sigma factor [Tannerellaceae bacterium]|jgi:RNA polymerase sigma-70 factor (ECF subfamily)|nr:RNA polymerase sigma factor [Tannerellaceae bacterium]
MNALQFQKNLLSIQENMMNFALSLTSNQYDAEDLLQETTLKVLDNKDKFVDNINFKGWVLTVMRNIFINNYHKIVRTQIMIDQRLDIYHLNVIDESDADKMDYIFQLQALTDAIDKLSDELKYPLSMYLSGYKYTEIAQKLNVPLGTVKSRIFFARRELQKAFKDA